MPIRLVLKTSNGGRYTTIVKAGDDLRQACRYFTARQLIPRRISWSSRSLRSSTSCGRRRTSTSSSRRIACWRQSTLPAHTALQLTPDSTEQGLVELIPSHAVASVLRDFGSTQASRYKSCALTAHALHNFLRKHNLSEDAPYQISKVTQP